MPQKQFTVTIENIPPVSMQCNVIYHTFMAEQLFPPVTGYSVRVIERNAGIMASFILLLHLLNLYIFARVHSLSPMMSAAR